MGVHRKAIGLLCLLRWHQRVASVRQRSGSIRSSIHMLHIRPPRAEERWGVLSGMESKTHRQQSITPANTRRTNRFIIGCFARRRPCSPTLVSWWPEGSEPLSRRRAGSCPAPSRGVLFARDEGSILPREGRTYHSIAVFITTFFANFREIPLAEVPLQHPA